MTSSFFSADGTNMVSTCIDNKIRIFNTKLFNSDAISKLKVLKFSMIIDVSACQKETTYLFYTKILDTSNYTIIDFWLHWFPIFQNFCTIVKCYDHFLSY